MSGWFGAGCAVAAVAVAIRPWHLPARPITGDADRRLPTARLHLTAGGPVWGGAIVAAAWVHPIVAIGVALAPTIRDRRASRRARAGEMVEIERALPEAVDLVGLAAGSGLTARAAVERSAAWMPHPFGAAFTHAIRRSDAGESFAAAIESATATFPDTARPFLSAVADADLGGGSLLPTLTRIGDEARRRRRAAAQARARRLPVTMLLPLVLCVLPAFALVAVVPLLLASLAELGL